MSDFQIVIRVTRVGSGPVSVVLETPSTGNTISGRVTPDGPAADRAAAEAIGALVESGLITEIARVRDGWR